MLWVLNALGLAIIVVRRRTVGIALIALQSLLLGALAITEVESSRSALIIAVAIGVGRGVVLPALLLRVVRSTREAGRLSTERPAFLRFVVALATITVAAVLVPRFGLEPHGAERAVIALVIGGIVIAAVRRSVVFQAIGFLVAENGIYLAGLTVPGGLPGALELALLFDLVVVLAVAGVFGSRIHEHFGTSDTTIMRELRD